MIKKTKEHESMCEQWKSYQEHISDNRPIAIKCNLPEKYTNISQRGIPRYEEHRGRDERRTNK